MRSGALMKKKNGNKKTALHMRRGFYFIEILMQLRIYS